VRVLIRSWDSARGTKGAGAVFVEPRTAVRDVMSDDDWLLGIKGLYTVIGVWS